MVPTTTVVPSLGFRVQGFGFRVQVVGVVERLDRREAVKSP